MTESFPWLLPLSVICARLCWPSKFAFTSDEARHDDPLRVAYTLDLLAIALTSGIAVQTAVLAVADAVRGAHREELLRVHAAMAWGVSGHRAWAAAGEHWSSAGQAFGIAHQAGASLSPILHNAARDLRNEEHRRVSEAAGRAGVRIVLPLGLCFLPAFLVLTVVPLVVGLVRL